MNIALWIIQGLLAAIFLFAGGTGLLDTPALNIAYWNLHERRLTQDGDGRVLCEGEPAEVFHFSGIASPINVRALLEILGFGGCHRCPEKE